MYVLTKEEDSIESGVYAGTDDDGDHIVQFFVDKDDAITYNTFLEALGEDLHITETETDSVDKLCCALGFAYTVVEPGEMVIPRMETFMKDQ